MQARTRIGERDYVIKGSEKAVNTFIKVKLALEKDGFEIVLSESRDSNGREPYQTLEVDGVGKVFLTGTLSSSVLTVELPLETPVYA